MIKYIGSKRVLVGRIAGCIAAAPGVRTVLDLFSGTSRVGHELKRRGLRVIANDHNAYAHTLASCYVQADLEDVQREALALIEELNALPPADGYVTRVFCREARYFHEKNGARIDAIRDEIARRTHLGDDTRAVLLTSLIEAADRVDSTTGVQMAYLKQLAQRATNNLCLRMPDVLPRAAAGKGQALMLDALDAAAHVEADAAYIDPPYNQHSYLGNYHVWETIVRWDAPETYGIARKRADCRQRRSPFNTRAGCRRAMADLLRRVRAPMLLVSHSDEGFVARDDMRAMLLDVADGRTLRTVAIDYPRYVGARIGIFNPQGRRVGRVSHLRNTEFISVLAPADMLAHIDEHANFDTNPPPPLPPPSPPPAPPLACAR